MNTLVSRPSIIYIALRGQICKQIHAVKCGIRIINSLQIREREGWTIQSEGSGKVFIV